MTKHAVESTLALQTTTNHEHMTQLQRPRVCRLWEEQDGLQLCQTPLLLQGHLSLSMMAKREKIQDVLMQTYLSTTL